MLNEPPNFFNPFLENNKENNINYNPFYTNDKRKISLNTNNFLIQRFLVINMNIKNFNFNERYFSQEEMRYLLKVFILQTFISFSTMICNFRFYKAKKYIPITGLVMLQYSFVYLFTYKEVKFTLYNSYLRNFNGYTDEQIDYIMSYNQRRGKELKV